MINYLIILGLVFSQVSLFAVRNSDFVRDDSDELSTAFCIDPFDGFSKRGSIVCSPLQRLKIDRETRIRTRFLLYDRFMYFFTVAYREKRVSQLVYLANKLNEFVSPLLLQQKNIDIKSHLMSAIICNDQRAINILLQGNLVLSHSELVALESCFNNFKTIKTTCFNGIMYYNDCIGHSNT